MDAAFVEPPKIRSDGLTADGPNEEHKNKLMLFGQFVGDWEADFVVHNRDGTTQTERAEWHWRWILEGRAVQDVWILPRRADRDASSFQRPDYGTSVRFYDATIDAWRTVWISPPHGELVQFIARPVGDEIMLEGNAMDGTLMHWIFSEITPNSYHWRRMHSYDEGKTWQLIKEMRVHRIN